MKKNEEMVKKLKKKCKNKIYIYIVCSYILCVLSFMNMNMQ